MGSHQNFNLHETLVTIANDDAQIVLEKDKSYGSSWKKRGGVGAFMMLARKWDRIENMVQEDKWDMFKTLQRTHANQESETLLETIRDLRQYLLLVESEVVRCNQIREPIYVTDVGDGSEEIKVEREPSVVLPD
jgi:hypothetical protein